MVFRVFRELNSDRSGTVPADRPTRRGTADLSIAVCCPHIEGREFPGEDPRLSMGSFCIYV